MDHPSGRQEDSLLFTPQPPAPAMLGQRHPDSVLFQPSLLEASGRPREPVDDRHGSGFVDVSSIVELPVDGAKIVESKAALVAEIESRAPLPMDDAPPQPHGIVLATIVVTILGLITVAVAVFT